MIWFLATLCFVLAGLLATSLFYLNRFTTLVFRMEEEIENSLDDLDKSYGRIGQILEIPVGSDDPFVKAVIDEIKRAQHAVLTVAQNLSEGWKKNPKSDERIEDSN